MTSISRVFGIAALGLAVMMAGPAIAQTQGSQSGQMPSATQPTQNFSQKQLQSFADASIEIRDIRQSARQAMQQAGSQNEKTQARKQAQQDMLAAIKDSGLTLKEYNQIGRAARSNPQLAQQIEQMQ